MTDNALERTPKDRQLTPMDLMQLAINKEGSIDVIERLAKLQQDFMDREARVAFAQAFADFKANLPKILKTKEVSFGAGKAAYWHVELDKALDVLIPALNAVGITHRWKSAPQVNGGTIVTCYLKHRLGFEEEGASMAAPPDNSGSKNPVQAVGSTLTYLQRYTLLATCGIAPTGVDADAVPPPTMPNLEELLDHIGLADSVEELQRVYFKARDAAIAAKDKAAEKLLAQAKNERFKELKRGQK